MAWPVPILAFLDVGSGELVVIALVALILYGGRLPEVARSFGRTIGSLRRQADDLTREFREEYEEAVRRPYERPRPRSSDPTRLRSPAPRGALPATSDEVVDPQEGNREVLEADPDDDGRPSEERAREEAASLAPQPNAPLVQDSGRHSSVVGSGGAAGSAADEPVGPGEDVSGESEASTS